jgi:hypothetical protein
MPLVCLLAIVGILHTPIVVEAVDTRSCRLPSNMEDLAAVAKQVRYSVRAVAGCKQSLTAAAVAAVAQQREKTPIVQVERL